MKETSKAMRRRWCEHAAGGFPWVDVMTGPGIDVGSGDDKLPFDDCTGFDQQNGDANRLADYFPPASLHYIHASQSLEHMTNPTEALENWSVLVEGGGHIVITVPSWELYEGERWPSRYNPDHKSTWSMRAKRSPARHHVFVPQWVTGFPALEPLLFRELTANYDRKIGTKVDQTIPESEGVEPWIEIVFRKR